VQAQAKETELRIAVQLQRADPVEQDEENSWEAGEEPTEFFERDENDRERRVSWGPIPVADGEAPNDDEVENDDDDSFF
jgi:hypothetical protein